MRLKNFWQNPINRLYAFSVFKYATLFSAVLVPFFTEWGGITLFQVQLLQSWFNLWVFILEVLTRAFATYFINISILVVGLLPSLSLFIKSAES